jgi:hypothetical protein
MSKTIETQTTIAAPPARVWEALTDFASYPAWNPFIRSISGELRQGAQLSVRFAPSGGDGIAMRPTVTQVQHGAVLEWLGHLVVPGIFDGRHRFELTPAPGGSTSFVQRETFSGIMIPFVSALLSDTERSFAAFNAALKNRVEGAP